MANDIPLPACIARPGRSAEVAYLKAYQESEVRAERLGLFVIRATGSSASITYRERFTPRTFGHRSPAPSRQAERSG